MTGLEDADANFFNVSQLPLEVKRRVLTHRDPSIYMTKQAMTRYRNDLTKDPAGVMREWNFVLFPLTTQRFLVTRCGIVYDLSTLTGTLRKTFLQNIPNLTDDKPHTWYAWYSQLENHCAAHHIYLPPIDETRICNDNKGFKVGDHRFGDDVDFPYHLSEKLTLFEQLLYRGLVKEGVLPASLLPKVLLAPNQGYHALRMLQSKYHTELQVIRGGYNVCKHQLPGESIDDYILQYKFFLRMLAYMDNYSTDIGDINEQTKFLHYLQHSMELLQFIRSDRNINPIEMRYSAGQFFNTVTHIVNTIILPRRSAPRHLPSPSSLSKSRRHPTQGGSRTMSTTAKLRQLKSVHSEPFDIHNLYPLLDTVDIPEDEYHALFMLDGGLQQLATNPDRYRSFPCAVCNGEGHSFQDCPSLQHTPKVKEVYGKLRAYMNRFCNVANKLNRSLTELQKAPVQQLQMYALMSTQAPSSATVDLSALTAPTGIKSVGLSLGSTAPTTPTLPAEDESTDGSSCGNSLDFH